jgi:hypothetical protein
MSRAIYERSRPILIQENQSKSTSSVEVIQEIGPKRCSSIRLRLPTSTVRVRPRHISSVMEEEMLWYCNRMASHNHSRAKSNLNIFKVIYILVVMLCLVLSHLEDQFTYTIFYEKKIIFGHLFTFFTQQQSRFPKESLQARLFMSRRQMDKLMKLWCPRALGLGRRLL